MARTARKTPNEKPRAAKDRQFVTALARGLEILRAFTPRHPVLGNNEIAQRAHLPGAHAAGAQHVALDAARRRGGRVGRSTHGRAHCRVRP